MNNFFSITTLLILIMDPLGNLPIVMSLLKNIEPNRQRKIIMRELFIALLFMFLFLFSGEKILEFLNLHVETVSISGGVILFLISIRMIFPDPNHKNDNSENEEPFVVPLAIPLLAGPAILATLILLSHQYPNQIGYLITSLILSWSITSAILLQSSFFLYLLGKKGINALERLMGLILIMIAIQMLLDGIRK